MKTTATTANTIKTTATILTKTTANRQQKAFVKTVTPANEGGYDEIIVKIIYDDRNGNGHNSFSITCGTLIEGDEDMYGCIHDEIEKHFPELSHLIKWHNMTSDGPLYYIENTLYFVSGKDYNGLRKGESKQLINGRTKLPVWKRVVLDADGNQAIDTAVSKRVGSAEKPTEKFTVEWMPVMIEGKGEKIDIEAARKCAIWPEATLEQLRDKEQLEARLPGLIQDFKKDVEALGFEF